MYMNRFIVSSAFTVELICMYTRLLVEECNNNIQDTFYPGSVCMHVHMFTPMVACPYLV